MPEPQPIFDALGRVIFESSHMEVAYGELVASLGGHLAIFFVRGRGPAQLERPARRLLDNEHIPEPVRSQIREALQRAEELLKKRNHVAHGRWWLFPMDDQWTSAKPVMHSIRDDVQKWSLRDLYQLAEDMAQCRWRLVVCKSNIWTLEIGEGELEDPARGAVVTNHLDGF